MALMHMCANSPLAGESASHAAGGRAGGGAITVLHVNHGLRPGAARDSKFVAAAARALGLPCVVLEWAGKKPKTGIEDAARTARYELLSGWCRENDVGTLLIAHQADDQIETFLMNLGRGSGVYGLAAMRGEQILDGIAIARPLLSASRAELEKYCAKNKIKYIHDEMNDDENFTRVKIRKNRYVLRDLLGIADDRILTAIQNLGRVRDMLEQNVDELIKDVAADGRAVFTAAYFSGIPDEMRMKFLSRILQTIGKSDYGPRLEKVARADYMLQSDCKFTVNKCIVRRLGNKILIAPEGSSSSFRK